MVEAGHQTEADLLELLNRCVEHTLESLDLTSLGQAFYSDAPLLSYTTGMLVLAAAKSAAAADGVPEDGFDIDTAMAALSENTREHSPLRGLTSVLHAMGATDEATDAIEAFITEHHSDPEAALIDRFDATGVRYTFDGGQPVVE